MNTYIQMRAQIRTTLSKAGFAKTLTQASQSILDAKIEASVQRRLRYFNYETQGFDEVAKKRPGVMGRPSEKNFRFYLYATILRAWVSEFGLVPKVHKNNFAHHPFVGLIRALLYPRGNTKLQHHLEQFFAYRRQEIKNNCIFLQKT